MGDKPCFLVNGELASNYDCAIGDEARDDITRAIDELGLGLKGFSRSRGGYFKCPCCSEKLFTNYKHGRWWITSFDKLCSDFGTPHRYPNDRIGLYMAKKQMAPTEENWYIMAKELYPNYDLNHELTEAEKIEFQKQKEKKEEERKRYDEKISAQVKETLTEIYKNSKFGSDFPYKGKALLQKRKITFDHLQPWTKNNIGLSEDVKIKKISGEGTYSWNCITFALGDKTLGVAEGYQGRNVSRDFKEYVAKTRQDDKGSSAIKCLTYGKTKLFNQDIVNVLNKDNACVFITEAPIDAISIEEGIQRNDRPDGGLCVSMQGCQNTTSVLGLLDAVKDRPYPVYLVLGLDNDDAGKRGSEALKKYIEDYQKEKGTENVHILAELGHGGHKDPNEFLQEEYDSAKRYYRTIHAVSRFLTRGDITEDKAKNLIDGIKTDRDINNVIQELQTIDKYKTMEKARDNIHSVTTPKIIIDKERE